MKPAVLVDVDVLAAVLAPDIPELLESAYIATSSPQQSRSANIPSFPRRTCYFR